MENKESPPADKKSATSEKSDVTPAVARAAARAAEEAATQAKVKAFYDKLFPPETPQRRFAPLILLTLLLVILLLAKCAVSSVGEKITAVAEAHAEAVRVQTSGSLLVKSNRAGVAVEAVRVAAAGEAASEATKGTIDQALAGLPAGKYAVTLRSAGWPEMHGEAVVEAQHTAELTINFKTGSLRLDSDPAGATVRQGEAVLGQTPLVIPQLPVGEVALSLEYPSWPAVTVKTTIKENAESAESVRLPYGKVTVQSTPAGATVQLEGRTVGQTPLVVEHVPAGARKFTLQAKDFPVLKVSLTVNDHDDVKTAVDMGMGFPELDPSVLLRAVWVPDNPDKLSPGFDTGGIYAPRNGIVKNLNRKRLYENWLRRMYRYSGIIKLYDPATGKIEFAEQADPLSRYRVLAELSPAARADKDVVAQLGKGATFALYGRLGAADEPHWPGKVITLELSAAELLH